MVSPTFGFGLSTLIVVTKLALVTVTSTKVISPLVVGSAWSPLATESIVFDMVCPPWFEFIWALIFKEALSPEFKVPMVQTPVTES